MLTFRFTEAGGGFKEGILVRFLNSFQLALDSPGLNFFGSGIGVGTNVGAFLLTGRKGFPLGENEWARVVAELGIIMGPAFLILRIAIVFYLAKLSIRSVKDKNYLPIFIFSACFITILNGSFSQPTILGFAVFAGGLCLSACKTNS